MCNSGEVKFNGRSRHGGQRLKCQTCKHTFGWKNRINASMRKKVWFDSWIKEGYTQKQLSVQSGWSTTTLTRIINRALTISPPIIPVARAQHVVFDGTFIYRRSLGAMVMMDGQKHELIAGRYGIKESFPHLKMFFQELRQQGCLPQSATIDGNPWAIQAFRAVWPGIIIQRCLVHVQRQGLMWCRAKPKRIEAKKLRNLFLKVVWIKTIKERDGFLTELASWEARYGRRIRNSRETGWVLSDLKRARSMLIHALPDMFHYLENQLIPWNTNGLEGYFSRLKHKYRQHRGLAPDHRKGYFEWFFFLCRR